MQECYCANMARKHARMFMIPNPILECKNHLLFLTKITKITKTDTLVVTKMAEKPYPLIWGRTYLYSPYKGMNPPPPLPPGVEPTHMAAT